LAIYSSVQEQNVLGCRAGVEAPIGLQATGIAPDWCGWKRPSAGGEKENLRGGFFLEARGKKTLSYLYSINHRTVIACGLLIWGQWDVKVNQGSSSLFPEGGGEKSHLGGNGSLRSGPENLMVAWHPGNRGRGPL